VVLAPGTYQVYATLRVAPRLRPSTEARRI
jgi:hypothetical protein